MLFLFTTACDQDIDLEIPQTQVAKSPFKVKTVCPEEIPNIKDYINSKTNNIFYKESTNKDGAIFDVENIMEVMDTLNYVNYSFRFVYPDTPVGTFYNLVVGKTPEGEAKEPFVLKYICDEAYLDEFIANNNNFQYFKGKVGLHKYTDFFQDGNFYKGDTYCPPNLDANGDPIPCDKITLDGSNPDSGGSDSENASGDGTGDGGTTSGTGGDGTIVWSDTGDPDADTGSSSDNSSSGNTSSGNSSSGGSYSSCLESVCVETNGYGDCIDYVIYINPNCLNEKKSTIVKKGDTTSDCPECPKPDGGIGILSPEDTLNAKLSINSPYDVDMSTILDNINLPLPDSTKIANEKLLCVYKKLTTSPTFKKLFTDIFGENKNLNVTFKVTKDLTYTKPNGEVVKVNGLTSTLSGKRNTTTKEVTGLEVQIEINEKLLTSNSSFNAAKTILHESIHAYLILTQLNHNPTFPLDYYAGIDISELLNIAANSLRNGSVTQHEFMFNYMLPIFQNVFTEIGNTNLTSQTSITNVEKDKLPLDNNPSVDWNWDDFYYYFSMQGLHNTQSFKNEIENNSLKNDLFNAYIKESKNLTKTCN